MNISRNADKDLIIDGRIYLDFTRIGATGLVCLEKLEIESRNTRNWRRITSPRLLATVETWLRAEGGAA